MASVDSLLNPATSSGSSSRYAWASAMRPDLALARAEHAHPYRRPPKRPSEAGSPSPTPENAEDQPTTEQSYYGQTDVVVRPHEPHPQCPNTLSCLPDTDGRPQHTLPVILRCAILGSPKKRLTIREIYAAMERKYPYYLTAGPAWKVSLATNWIPHVPLNQEPRLSSNRSNPCDTIYLSIDCSSANPGQPPIPASGPTGLSTLKHLREPNALANAGVRIKLVSTPIPSSSLLCCMALR